MRSLKIVLVVSLALILPGCASWNDMLYSLFGGTDSNQVDMNQKNTKNGDGWPQTWN